MAASTRVLATELGPQDPEAVASERRWLSAAVAYGLAVFLVDVLLGPDEAFTGLFGMVPVLAAFGVSVRVTALCCPPVLALAVTDLFGWNDTPRSTVLVRAAGVLVGCAIGLAAAVDRDRRARSRADRRRREAQADRTRAESEARERRMATATALAGAIDAAGVLEAIGERAVPELGHSVLGLWLLDEGGEHLRFAGGHGFAPSLPGSIAPVPLASDLPGAVAVRESRPITYRSRADRDARWPELAGVPSTAEATAVVPLLARGEAFGCLSFGFAEQSDFDDQRLGVLCAVADECALALDRALLFERERDTRRVLEFLAEATELLVSSRDPLMLLRRLADLAVPRLANWCAIYVGEQDGLHAVAVAGGRSGGPDPEGPISRMVVPFDTSLPAAEAWRTGEPQWVPDIVSVLDEAGRYGEISAVATAAGITSAFAVPIRSEGTVVGVMSTAYAAGRGRSAVDRYAIDGLAARAGVALAAVRRLHEEKQTVEALTAALLPRSLPEVAGYELAARYLPASGRVSGDWYEAAALPGGDLLLGVGDAAGHGISASSTMAALRNAATSQALTGASPAEILEVLARLASIEPEPVYATALYLRLEPTAGRLRIASAGHPPALQRLRSGCVVELERGAGVPIGASTGRPYRDGSAELAEGDVLVIVTDGVIERRGEVITDGLDRLVRLVEAYGEQGAEELAGRIARDLCGGREDDCCIVVLRRLPA